MKLAKRALFPSILLFCTAHAIAQLGGNALGDVSGSDSRCCGPESGNPYWNMNQFLKKWPRVGDQIASLTEMKAVDACKGFPDVAQCFAAAHIAANLGVGFDCLKTHLIRHAPPATANCVAPPASLAFRYRTRLNRALQTFHPGVDPKAEIDKAKDQVEHDVEVATGFIPSYDHRVAVRSVFHALQLNTMVDR
ncbi:MAG TPA: hypothetical protein VK812_02325 [Candidatus Binatus sp.]|nr:hypothetical protein [Candidatus Binatus sp.]